MAHHIFVYGTLKQGYRLSSYMNGQLIGTAKTMAEYRMYNIGTFPGLVQSATGVEVEGEVWAIDDDCLKVLDRVEAVDQGLYRRGPIQLQTPFNEFDVEWYFYQQSTDGLADSGTCW